MLKLASFAAVAVLAATPLAAQAAQHSATCFRTDDIQNTKMTPDDRAMYLRSSTGAFYKIEFGGACPNPTDAPPVLHPINNTNIVCGPAGLDIKIPGAEGCIPTKLIRLTPAEVAKIPPAQRP